MNMHQARHNLRTKLIRELFEDHYRKSIDDFFEARNQMLQDISEVFQNEYDVEFQTIALDNHKTDGRREARRILQELVSKL